jgi:hypothetical protein
VKKISPLVILLLDSRAHVVLAFGVAMELDSWDVGDVINFLNTNVSKYYSDDRDAFQNVVEAFRHYKINGKVLKAGGFSIGFQTDIYLKSPILPRKNI